MGDCVEVLLAGSGKEEVTKGYAEILWLWRSAAVPEEVGRKGWREGGREGGKVGDCVEVLLAGSGKEELTKGYAEILWLWRSAAVQEEVGRGGSLIRVGLSVAPSKGFNCFLILSPPLCTAFFRRRLLRRRQRLHLLLLPPALPLLLLLARRGGYDGSEMVLVPARIASPEGGQGQVPSEGSL